MKAKTVLILGAAALYFYGPRLTARLADEAGEALESLADKTQSGQSKSRRSKSDTKALPQPDSFANDIPDAEQDEESFEERTAAAHMTRRNGKAAMRNGTDGI
jgi:hypothetical protein